MPPLVNPEWLAQTAAVLRKKAIDAVSVMMDDEQEKLEQGVEEAIRSELERAVGIRRPGSGQQRLF